MQMLFLSLYIAMALAQEMAYGHSVPKKNKSTMLFETKHPAKDSQTYA